MKAIPLHKKLLKGFIKVANWERTSKKKTAKTTWLKAPVLIRKNVCISKTARLQNSLGLKMNEYKSLDIFVPQR